MAIETGGDLPGIVAGFARIRSDAESATDHDSWATRREDFAYRCRNRSDAGRMLRHVSQSCCWKPTDHCCHGTHGDHTRASWDTGGQHTRQGHIRHPRSRHTPDQDRRRTRRNNLERHRWVRNRRRRRSGRMDRRVAMRCHLNHHVHHSSRRHSHNSPHSNTNRIHHAARKCRVSTTHSRGKSAKGCEKTEDFRQNA
jgi:hypothetical protein